MMALCMLDDDCCHAGGLLQGEDLTDEELIEYISEATTMSKTVEEYEGGCALRSLEGGGVLWPASHGSQGRGGARGWLTRQSINQLARSGAGRSCRLCWRAGSP